MFQNYLKYPLRGAALVPVLLLAILLAPVAGEGSERAMSVSELVSVSDAVVRGEVISHTGRMHQTDAGSFPFIYYRVRVSERIVGDCPDLITVRVPGMMVEDRIAPMPGAAPLTEGAEFVLFLKGTGEPCPEAGDPFLRRPLRLPNLPRTPVGPRDPGPAGAQACQDPVARVTHRGTPFRRQVRAGSWARSRVACGSRSRGRDASVTGVAGG